MSTNPSSSEHAATVWALFQIGLERYRLEQLTLGKIEWIGLANNSYWYGLLPHEIESACNYLVESGQVISNPEGTFELSQIGMANWETQFLANWDASFTSDVDETRRIITASSLTTIMRLLATSSICELIDVSTVSLEEVEYFCPLYWHRITPAWRLSFSANIMMELPMVLQSFANAWLWDPSFTHPMSRFCKKITVQIDEHVAESEKFCRWFASPDDVCPSFRGSE